MPTLVLRLGSLDVARGSAEAVVALKPDGTIDLAIDATLSEAARQLAGRLDRDVVCEEPLAFVGRALDWTVRALTRDELLFRASLALSIASEFPPTWQDVLQRLIEAWCVFSPMALWEQVPPEMAFPLERLRKGRTSRPAVSVLGQSGREFGAAVYDDLDDFDRLFDGEGMQGKNRSVLADPGALSNAFDPLKVPCPVVITTRGMLPRKPTRDDLLLLAGAIELLVGVVNRVPETELETGDVLRFKRSDEPTTSPKGRQKTEQAPRKPVSKRGSRAR
ncbi:MAG: hypothetical protein SFW67_35335 [Myxococcaceae bacterium]|nr:hypothetical protein [Myxococcaceae bacterium]